MKIAARFAVCALLFLPASSLVAQTLPTPIDDPEATVVSELIVRAPTPGPAWWRVSKGSSVVWILGMPVGPTPKNLAWDRSALERRLKGANFLLTPPRGSINFTGGKGDIPLMRMIPGLRQLNGNVEKAMPAPLAQRFASVRTRLKKPVRRYAMPIPLISGFILNGDFNTWAGLDRWGVWGQVEATAKRAGIKPAPPVRVALGSAAMADFALTRPEAAACFGALLDSSEVPVARYREAAAGWAKGDVATAVSAPRDPYTICENRLFQQGYTRTSIDIQTKAIRAALKVPGKTVVLSHLRTLLAPDGVLERLAADGYEIVDPAGVVTD